MDNKKKYVLYMRALVLLVLLIPVAIYMLVNKYGGSQYLSKGEILTYYATIIGYCFTGYVTASGLFFTLKQNASTFNEQRRIDRYYREEDKVNSAMPVLKIGEASIDKCDMCLNANLGDESAVNHIKVYIKNIGLGPAINIKIKLGDYYANNSINVKNTFDLGMGENVTIDIRAKFDIIEKEINRHKCIEMILEFEDVFNKRKYKHYINAIQPNQYSNFNIFENQKKETIIQ